MKAAGFFLLLLVWQTSFSQFIDSFDDGELESSPPWSGDTADFSVIGNQLFLKAPPISSTSYIITTSSAIDEATWEFVVGMEFNPSSSNYAELYLASNNYNLGEELNGYLIRIGWTTDNVSLIRQDGNLKTPVISGIEKRLDLSQVAVKIRVTRSKAGAWELFTKLEGEANWLSEGTSIDLTYIKSEFFGIKCKYTSTRADKFYFDDIIVKGMPYVDSNKPEIDSAYSTNEHTLKLVMSEPIDSTSVQRSNLILNNSEQPLEAIVADNIIVLNFEDSLSVINTLHISGIRDEAGNEIIPHQVDFIHYSTTVEYGDIIINEILPDPSPPEDLAEVEYVEIMNTTPRAIYMTKWSLSDRTTSSVLPNIKLMPDSILVLYKANTEKSLNIPNALAINQWPSLNNSGDEISLYDSSKVLIDKIVYSDSWYNNLEKQAGGWSLERINPYLPCSGSTNWRVSENNSGGTPGMTNSVFEITNDIEPPQLKQVFAFAHDSVVAYFSEPLGNLPFSVEIDQEDVTNYAFLANDYSAIILYPDSLLPQKIYTITISGFNDCAGNQTNSNSLDLVLPEKAEPNDIIINEILFNPRADYHDYLEIYNQSPRYISLANYTITNGTSSKEIGRIHIVGPNEYRVLTADVEEILHNYPRSDERNILLQELPAFTNEAGFAVVKDNHGLALDSITYNEKWHFAYLNDFEGIALERISFLRTGTVESNWASASTQHNYGTPGYVNSQTSKDPNETPISIEPKVIVPNADGRDDFTTIRITEHENALVTVRIYNLHGSEIEMLANNELLAGQYILTWDGTDRHGITVPLGHYVLVVDFILENGQAVSYREKMVVGTGY